MQRILAIDGHPIVGRGLKDLIQEQLPSWTCSVVRTPDEALRALSKEAFQLIITELALGAGTGLEFVRNLHRAYPAIPILAFSGYPETQFAARSFRAGASGYISKTADSEQLIGAIEAVVSGGKYVSPAVAGQIALEALRPAPQARLSNREYEILRALAMGNTVTEISRTLGLSVKTISGHKRRVMAKLHVTNNVELIRRAIADGVLGEPDVNTKAGF